MRELTFVAYDPRPLWHTNPDFCATGGEFIGGGGGLQHVEYAPQA